MRMGDENDINSDIIRIFSVSFPRGGLRLDQHNITKYCGVNKAEK